MLTWAGPIAVPAASGDVPGTVSLHFGVTASTTAGDYFNNAEAQSADYTVVPTGDTARVTVSQSMQEVTIDTLSDPLLGPGESSTDVTWHATENGPYSVRLGGSDCASGTAARLRRILDRPRHDDERAGLRSRRGRQHDSRVRHRGQQHGVRRDGHHEGHDGAGGSSFCFAHAARLLGHLDRADLVGGRKRCLRGSPWRHRLRVGRAARLRQLRDLAIEQRTHDPRLHAFRGRQHDSRLRHRCHHEQAAQYACDVTYGTNNELGFDYLRDNMKMRAQEMVQRGHYFSIVDEVDSILIDEARTPLIISGPVEDRAELYNALDSW